MELFAFIGLLLSVFGAALAAISGLRTHYDDFLSNTLSDLGTKVDQIASRGLKSKKAAGRKALWVKIWHRVWMVCHWVPVALFTFLTFGIIRYVCYKVAVAAGTDFLESTQICYTTMKKVLVPFSWLNFGCFAVALLSVSLIKLLYKALGDMETVAIDPGKAIEE